jgi:molybdopterin synthase sulfur carrier subunit
VRLKLASGREELWVEFPEGTPVNVAQLLQSVKDRWPDLYQRCCDREGTMRPSLSIFVDGEHVRYRDGMETELHDGSEVYVIPIVAGG